MRASLAVSAVVVISLFAGCGYRPLLSSGEGSRRVAVPMAKNETAFGALAAPLTKALRARLEGMGIEVVGARGEAALLQVVIVEVDDGPGMLGAEDGRLVSRDVEWRVEVEVSLIGPAGEAMIPATRVEATGRAIAAGGILREEARGARTRAELLDDLAQRIALLVLTATDK